MQLFFELSAADFSFKLHHDQAFSTPATYHSLKKIPGMSKTETCKRIFAGIHSGTFSLKQWFDNLGDRSISNLQKKHCEIYWGGEFVIGSRYDCVDTQIHESQDTR